MRLKCCWFKIYIGFPKITQRININLYLLENEILFWDYCHCDLRGSAFSYINTFSIVEIIHLNVSLDRFLAYLLTLYPIYRGAAIIKTGPSSTLMQDIIREQCIEQITIGIFTTIWVSTMKEIKGEEVLRKYIMKCKLKLV